MKKNYDKNNYCLRDMTMFPNGNIGGFLTQTVETNSKLFIIIPNNQSNQLTQIHGTYLSTQQRLI